MTRTRHRGGHRTMQELENLLQMPIAAVAAGAEKFLTVWLPIQLVTIAFAELLAWLAAVLVRRRLHIGDMTMGWPSSLRLLARAFARNLIAINFILILLLLRAALASAPASAGFDLMLVAAK